MILKWASKLFSKFGAVLLAGYIGWLGWTTLGPRKPEVGPARQKLATQAIEEIVETLRQNRGEAQNVVLLHFANDPSDHFTNQLRSVIERRGTLNLQDRTLMEKVRNQLELRHPPCSSTDEAAEEAAEAGADAALYGEINRFESFPGGARIDVNYWLVSSGGEVIYPGVYVHDTSPPPPPPPKAGAEVGDTEKATEFEATESTPWFKRGLAWLVVVLLLPVFTFAFIRHMVGKESNRTNAAMLSIYTLADGILAYLLVGAALDGFWPIFFFALAVIGAFLYNVHMMGYAHRLEAT
ncbi:MAG: hypothetical protein ACOC8H_00310 [bacterium]